MLKRLKNTRFSILQKLRNKIAPGKNVLKTVMAPTDIYDSTKTHTNFAMDEVAQEYIANITEQTYEQQNLLNPDFPTAPNFGTLDNPLQVFTTDYPFRFVACTGHPNEDDYEGHEPMWFILREGSMQRCCQCGQVFKLIKLRQNEDERNDYYNNLVGKPGLQELGDQDHPGVTSLRTFFQLQDSPTVISSPQSKFYQNLNPDDHDHFLVDPKYRMEKNMDGERMANQIQTNFQKLSQQYESQYGVSKTPMSRQVYENLVEAELAVKNLDRHFSNILKFNYRQILDPENHERREQRMLQRKQQRKVQNTGLKFFIDENKEGYLDYFETDLEGDSTQQMFDKFNEDKQEIFSSSKMKLNNIEFQEMYNEEKHPDAEGIVNRKIFRFKYREALYSKEDHDRKETRMVERNSDLQDLKQLQTESIQSHENELLEIDDQEAKNLNQQSNQESELRYYDALIKQSLKCYKDYFESDLEEDFDIVEEMPFQTQIKTTEMLKNTHVNFVLRIQPEQNQVGSDYAMNQINDLYQQTFGQLNKQTNFGTTLDSLNLHGLFKKAKIESYETVKRTVDRVEKIIKEKKPENWTTEDDENIKNISKHIQDLEERKSKGENVESMLEQLQDKYENLKKTISEKMGDLSKNIFNIRKDEDFDKIWDKGKEQNGYEDTEIKKRSDIKWKNEIDQKKEDAVSNKGIVSDTWDQTKEKAKETWDNVKDTANKMEQKIEENIPGMKEDAKEMWDKTKQKTKETWNNVKEKATQTEKKVEDKIPEMKEKAKETWDNTKQKAREVENKAEREMPDMKEKAKETWDKTKEKAREVENKVEKEMPDMKNKAQQTWENTKEKAKETWDNTKQKAREVENKAEREMPNLKEKAQQTWDKTKEKAREVENKAEEKVPEMKEKAKETWENTKEKAQQTWDKTKEKAKEVENKVEEKVPEMKEQAQNMWEKTKEKVGEVWEKTKEKVQDGAEVAKEKLQEGKEKLKDGAEVAKEKLQEGKEKLKDGAEVAKEKMQKGTEIAKEKMQEGKEKMQQGAEVAKEKMQQGKEKLKENTEIAKEKMQKGKENLKEELREDKEIAKEKLREGEQKIKQEKQNLNNRMQQDKEKLRQEEKTIEEKMRQGKEETKEKLREGKEKMQKTEQKVEEKLKEGKEYVQEKMEEGKQKVKDMKDKAEKMMKKDDDRVKEKSNVAKERLNQTKNTKDTIDTNKRGNKNKKK